jgi:hypothetical protein
MVVSQRDETEQRHLLHLSSIYSHFLATSTPRWPYIPSRAFASCTLNARLVARYDAADMNTTIESNKLINPWKTDR